MDTVSSRISTLLEEKNGGNQSELARYCGVSPQAVQKWIAGDSEPKGKNLKLVAEFLGTSPAEIKFGPGASHLPLVFKSVSIAEEGDPDIIEVRKVKLRLSAGITGFIADHEVDDGQPLSFRRSWIDKNGFAPTKLIAIKVKGESMEPALYEGDTVVINTADIKPKDGEVYAVNYEGEAVVKRLSRDIGKWWLCSDNPNQQKYHRKLCEGDACLIIGKVVQKQSERI